MTKTKAWIGAARLRTLPLAVSTMLMGHALAASDGFLKFDVAILSILTAISLQILSNLANDYGDSIHGADSSQRKGPQRAVQSGVIPAGEMKKSLYWLTAISFVLGVMLVFIAFDNWTMRMIFLLLGLLAIWAAINYTAGTSPYGYSGKGDLAVFIFFGLVTVLGSYFLQVHDLRWSIFLPAISCGLLSVGVLNINNIRDIDSDQKAGKRSVPVKIGRPAALRYHALLLFFAPLSLVLFGLAESFGMTSKWLFLISFPLLLVNFLAVRKHHDPMSLDPYLKQLALSTSAIILFFCICLFL